MKGLPSERVICVQSAVVAADYQHSCDKAAFLHEFRLRIEGRVISVIAQLIQRKGHRQPIAVLPELASTFPRLQVFIFGRGPLRESLEESVQASGLSDHVRFAGFRADLPRWRGCLDLVERRALLGELGVSLIQAAATGVPLVASRAGGMPEIVVDGETGFLTGPGDRHALFSSIQNLLNDASLRERLGAARKARLVWMFSVDAMVAGNLAVCEDLRAERVSV